MNKTHREQLQSLRRRKLAAALVAAMAMPVLPAMAQSLPENGNVVSGAATINNSDIVMTVTQTTKGAIINWDSFSIAYGFTVNFDQQFGANSVTLNRVVGGGYGISQSFIDGTLSSNGNVFLINPSGITFGSGSVVNVGGLVASTMDISDANFLTGVDSGHYQFEPMTNVGDQSVMVDYGAQINTSAKGTVALLGRQILNQGDITTPGGSVLFGSAESVTLDFQGDGLTMLTITGPGIAKPGSFGCPSLPCPGPVLPMVANTGNITADGGQIQMRTAMTASATGGLIIAGGTLRARGVSTRGGRVELTTDGDVMVGSPGILTDASTDFIPGSIDVSGGAYAGGAVVIRGDTVTLHNDADTVNGYPASYGSHIDASGAAGGGQIQIEASGAVNFDSLSWLNANSVTGTAGSIQINAGSGIASYAEISASAKAGNGGSILLDAGAGALLLGGDVLASGGTNGGQITGSGFDVMLPQGRMINAQGNSGAGGSISLSASNYLAAFGSLIARGGTTGGAILTSSDSLFDLRGLQVDAGSSGSAGRWTLDAPDLTVINGSAVGNQDAPQYGTTVQDAEINYAFYNGTSVVLNSNADVQFDDAQIYSDNAARLSFDVNAAGSIFGNAFSIAASNGPLDMVFNANSAGGSPYSGGIDFGSASLLSMGGNISMYGQSDPLNGYASSAVSGISLSGMTITTDGGNVLLRGTSTGSGAGVSMGESSIDAGSGGVAIYGTGSGAASGVSLNGGSITAGADGVLIHGQSTDADGLFASFTTLTISGGDIDLSGIGAAHGVYFAGDLYSNGGNIRVHGEGGSADGTTITGGIDSAGGLIDVFGSSTAATGLVLGGVGYYAVSSAGGDIVLYGEGATGGVVLHPGTLGNAIDSSGGALSITGHASAAGAIGVYADGVDLTSGAGALTVIGDAAQGVGIQFANGAGVTTTTGAIGLYGTGATFGLDVGNGAITTNSGNITLDGTATAANATAGVRVTGTGLATNGGTIVVTGNSAGGVGVQLGDGSNPFAVGSSGGAITIHGVGVDAGVLMQNNQVTSGGGAVAITGSGAALGVSLTNGGVDSAGGNVDVNGDASAAGGVGVNLDATLSTVAGQVNVQGIAASGRGIQLGAASGINTTTGSITLAGVGASSGLSIGGGTIATNSGHVDLRGRSTAPSSDGLAIADGVSISSNGGGIELSGEGTAAGLRLGAGAVVDAGNSLIVIRAANGGSGDALVLDGSLHSSVGVNLRPGGVDANGGVYDRITDQILLGHGDGFAISNDELGRISAPEVVIGSSQHAGAIHVQEAITRNGNLTLQNSGGGGIDLQAGVNVGNYTLALASGGDITQTASAAILAHSLLANASGNVQLGLAQNDVASTTLAGSAGGNFQFQDANDLAIGSVSALGFNASSGQLSSMGSTGVTAGGDALIRNLAGDMTLNAGVTATNIDLVTAGRLQNVSGAALTASGDWHVWASTWTGEARGGLAGDGNLPNLYGCAYLGACGVTVTGGDNHFIYVQQPIATITFDNATREYGLENPLFSYTVTGAILGDTAANVASGSASTSATIASDVGNYAITGNFTSAAGYKFQLMPGTLSITQATLVFTADPFVRYLGGANPDFTGTVAGFRNGDTQQSVFGSGNIWSSPAGPLSPVGFYPIVGGTIAKNYKFVQAPGNAAAFQIIPLPQLSSTPVDFIRETVDTYVYDRNFGAAPVCAVNATLDDQVLASTGDALANEWSKVRSRPNLTNCFDSEKRSSCGDF
ncbi:MAG: filamentous hemagglutinin N-terminal domain-containing protein [Proteobacteria bacterium]|nr:filamentous hemagglutinin N-terminal domain-containing protein [Pseudomonadota bacterium]